MWNFDRSRRPESFGGSRAGTRSLDLTVPGFRVGDERVQKVSRHRGHLRDGAIDRGLVGPGRLAESRDLPYELEGGIPNLRVGCGRVEVEQRFDVPAHVLWPRVPGRQDVEYSVAISDTHSLRGGKMARSVSGPCDNYQYRISLYVNVRRHHSSEEAGVVSVLQVYLTME